MASVLHMDDSVTVTSDLDTPGSAASAAFSIISEKSSLMYGDKLSTSDSICPASFDNIMSENEVEVPPVHDLLSRQISTGKRRKGFGLVLSPGDSVNKEMGMRQLSAAEERQIDKAIELANSFARLNANEHAKLTPHSPSASKESLNSPGHNSTHSFRFTAFKRRTAASTATTGALRDDKKTFIDSLMLSCDASAMFTPDAQAAYNELVAMSAPITAGVGTEFTTKLPTCKHFRAHRLLSDSPAPRPSLVRRLKRSSMSETDQEFVFPTAITQKRDTKPICYAESRGDSVPQPFRIELQSISSPDVTEPPPSELHFIRDDSHAPSSPPALPPRIPLRLSTVNNNPRQRCYPLTDDKRALNVASKHRSFSSIASHDLQCHDILVQRRETQSTNDDVVLKYRMSSTESIDSSRDSDDSVFSSDEQTPVLNAFHYQPCMNPNKEQSVCGASSNKVNSRHADFEVDQCDSHLIGGCKKQDIAAVAMDNANNNDLISYEDIMELALDGQIH